MPEEGEQGAQSIRVPPELSLHPASYIANAWILSAWRTVSSESPPQPAGITLGRAVSTAYFALFHAITLRAADLYASGDDPGERFSLVRRFRHRDLHRVSLWITGSGTPPPRWAAAVAGLREAEDVRTVAEALMLLREARTDADYNHAVSFTQNRATLLVWLASEASGIAGSDAFATSESGQAFLQIIADQVTPRP